MSPWADKSIYGKSCPLDKFKILPCTGNFDRDPLEVCMGGDETSSEKGCNFYNSIGKEKLEDSCLCPIDMTWKEYDLRRKEYMQTSGELTTVGFQEFVLEEAKLRDLSINLHK